MALSNAADNTRSGIRQGESNSNSPLITIITSTYNAAEYLPRLIQSIREQTYKNIEWIIVDGVSSDDTLDILRQNEDIIAYWMSEPDTGIYDAWNKAVRKATGDWVVFLGADDYLWTPDVLRQLVLTLVSAYPAYRIVYGKISLINDEGESVYCFGDAWGKVSKRFRSVMCVPHPALFYHQSLFELHGDFDTSFKIAGDYEFLLRELIHHAAVFKDIVVTGMSLGGVSSSPATSMGMLFEMRRATRKHGRISPGIPWLFAATRCLIRRFLWRLLGEKITRRLLDHGRRLLGKPAHWTRT